MAICSVILVSIPTSLFAGQYISEDNLQSPEIQVIAQRLDSLFAARLAKFGTLKPSTQTYIKNRFSDISIQLEMVETAYLNRDKTSLRRATKRLFSAWSDILQAASNNSSPLDGETFENTDFSGLTSVEMTYYADFFHGRTAANGETFYNDWFSGAKCDVDFNTLTQAIHQNKSVMLHINDRPHCGKHPKVLDLSQVTFESIGAKSIGRLNGYYQYLREAPYDFYKHYFKSSAFDSLGIAMDTNVPNMYLVGETLSLSGEQTSCGEDTVMLLKSPDGLTQKLSDIDEDPCRFLFATNLEKEGSYRSSFHQNSLGVHTDEMELKVYSEAIFEGKVYLANDTNLDTEPFENVFEDTEGQDFILFDFFDREYFEIHLDSSRYFGVGRVLVPKHVYQESKKKEVLFGRTSTGYSHDRYTDLSPVN